MILGLLLAVLLVPGGLALVGLVWFGLSSKRAAAKADAHWQPSWRVLVWARVWDVVEGIPYRFHLAILHNEAASSLRAPSPAEAGLFTGTIPSEIYPVGDMGDSRGPSYGPGQVLTHNIKALSDGGTLAGRGGASVSSLHFWMRWLKPRHPSDLARPGEEFRALYFSARMLKDALRKAGGDTTAAAGIYNGGPAWQGESGAVAYSDRAAKFLGRLA